MPLIYSGQEACLDKRLSFFDKDEIEWKECGMKEIYSKLLHLKREKKVLWNGYKGGEFKRIKTSNDKAVFAFSREIENDRIVVILNLSPFGQNIVLEDNSFAGEYSEIFKDEEIQLHKNEHFFLEPWKYEVFINH